MKKLTLYLLLFAMVLTMTACFSVPLPKGYEELTPPPKRADVAASDFEVGMTRDEVFALLGDNEVLDHIRVVCVEDKNGLLTFLHLGVGTQLRWISTRLKPSVIPSSDEIRITPHETDLEDVISMCGMPYVSTDITIGAGVPSYHFPLRDGKYLFVFANTNTEVGIYRIFTKEQIEQVLSSGDWEAFD